MLNWLEAKLFMDSKTALVLLIGGAALQVLSAWIAP
jgi:hypothetical protein